MKEYNYFFERNNMSDDDVNAIYNAINNHDYDLFVSLHKKFNEAGENLPNEITVYEEETDIMEYITVFDQDNFELIDYCKCRN